MGGGRQRDGKWEGNMELWSLICVVLSLPHSCMSQTVVVNAGAMSVKELCWQNCKNTARDGLFCCRGSTPCISGCSIVLCISLSALRDVGLPGRSISTIVPPHQKLLTTLCIAWTLHHAEHMVSVAVEGGGAWGRGEGEGREGGEAERRRRRVTDCSFLYSD